MPRYTEVDAREAVASSKSYTEALRKLGLRPAGGNHALFRKYVDQVWRIPTDHFDPYESARRNLRREAQPLLEVLVEGSSYRRGSLKYRLYAEGIKQPLCELCGQDELWRGRPMSLILDHVNGVPDDNRLENLRIVCPNCAATLETHCARKNRVLPLERSCLRCGRVFRVKSGRHKYCSRACGSRWDRRGRPKPWLRKVDRPTYDVLINEVKERGYSAVGRKYGVSDNAIRKWIRQYERERAAGILEDSTDSAYPDR